MSTELARHLDHALALIDSVSAASAQELEDALGHVAQMLDRDYGPHLEGEDAELYKTLLRTPEDPTAAALLHRDRYELVRLARSFAALRVRVTAPLTPSVGAELRMVLNGIYQHLRRHLAEHQQDPTPRRGTPSGTDRGA